MTASAGTGLDQLTVLVEGLDHPEGVTVSADGVLYAGGEAGQLYRINPDGWRVEQVASTGGFLLGVCVDGDGLVYCCDIVNKAVIRIDPLRGTQETFSSGNEERSMVNPNWAAFDDHGNLFVSDSGTWHGDDGCIFRVDPSGVTETWSRDCTNFPNGLCLDAAGTSLLVLESCTPALVRVPIRDDGSAGGREVVAELPGTIPDGVGLDVEGNAYICCYRPDRVLRVSPGGGVTVLADDPEGTILSAPTNCVWVGPDRRRWVCGNLGRWHLATADWGLAGLPLRYPAR